MAAPVNTVAPALTPTAPVLGDTLATTAGTWDGSYTYTYEWFRDGVLVSGLTTATRKFVRADLGCALQSRVTAANGDVPPLTKTAFSNATTPSAGTLVVEDGAGLSNAESFCSVAEADTYHDKRGNAAWAAKSLGDKEAALRSATDYMEQTFRFEWDGYRYSDVQSLSWPRYEVRQRDTVYGYRYWPAYYGYNTVPQLVRWACAELALRATQAALTKDTGGPLKKRVKVDVIETEYVESSLQQQVTYRSVEDMLDPFLSGGGRYRAQVSRS